MSWETKAIIMRISAEMPFGKWLYRIGKKWFGRLGARPMVRLTMQAEMLKWLHDAGKKVDGMRLFEVGTGHVPLVPIGFYLCGAEWVMTVDLHRRIDWRLVRKSLRWISCHREGIWALYANLIPEAVFNERFEALSRHVDDPKLFFNKAGIEYRAPMNAADTELSDNSVDCHFSVTTLEHIPLRAILDIFMESERILTREGTALHFVDLSDHFQHTDRSITRINFLRYSDEEWQKIAGNEFAYCNRLRKSDYLKLFEEFGLIIIRHESHVDPESVQAVYEKTIALHPHFFDYSLEDLCSTSLRVLLKKSSNRLLKK